MNPTREADGGTDQEDSVMLPDGGRTRRRFLGAAAAVAALPATANLGAAAGSSGAESLVEGRSVSEESGYAHTDCGAVPGSLGAVDVYTGPEDGALSVGGVHDVKGKSEVSLMWCFGPMTVDTGLEPDDARELADRLRVAAAAAEGGYDA